MSPPNKVALPASLKITLERWHQNQLEPLCALKAYAQKLIKDRGEVRGRAR